MGILMVIVWTLHGQQYQWRVRVADMKTCITGVRAFIADHKDDPRIKIVDTECEWTQKLGR